MPLMIVQQKVKDYRAWKKIFNAAYAIRKASGERSCKIFRNTEDPNEITLLLEWDDIQNAMKYSQSKLFKEAEKKAGAITEPILYLPEDGLDT
ncbi:MAG: hypothetical protein A3G91_03615 [Omnitrophica WOR_2 bacterium RIFCSPLOWO2_12_FULL_50_9]|nr:MAG: hypothetical protein A3D87_06715 [Omnitrophica WOR_2 bacterium RIFCSPHIGHO2_02_FULL_50_17]OGX43206.1 MAG: hypothetical protein A3G91_03615 [Omnitrophica WOR_2 bacterium RIFCSPLOWO2_12_FULL_50_9]